MHGAVLGQARLRAGVVVVMLPGDLSSPRLRLQSAEKQGRDWTRLLRGNVIDPLEWWRDGEVRQGAARGAEETERARRKETDSACSADRKATGTCSGCSGDRLRCSGSCLCGSPGENKSEREMRVIWTDNFTRSGSAERHTHVTAFKSHLKNNTKHALL